jgi:hypothetical protein
LALAGLAVLMALGSTAVSTALRPAAAGASQPRVERWEPAGLHGYPSLRFVPDVQGRRLFALTDGMIGVYDLDTLEPLAQPIANSGGSPVAAVFVPELDAVVFSHRGIVPLPVLVAVGVRNGALVQLASTDLSALLGRPTARILGVVTPPNSSWAYVMSAVADSGTDIVPHTLQLSQVSLNRFRNEASAPGEWAHALPECTNPVLHFSDLSIGYWKTALFVGCATPDTDNFLRPPLLAGGIGRVTLGTDASTGAPSFDRFDLFARDGDFSTGDVVVDQVKGRMVVFQRGVTGTTLYLFDENTATWLGGAAGSQYELRETGINEVSGRVYANGVDRAFGLLETEARLPVMNQGSTFSKAPEDTEPNTGTIAVDPLTGRLFFAYSDHVAIMQDPLPPVLPGAAPDPDLNTNDLAENPLLTGANFSGSAQGYGARMRFVGGVDDLQYNLVTVDPRGISVQGQFSVSGTREVRTAWLDYLTTANDIATAQAVGASRDVHTAQDEHDVSPTHDDVAWPYQIVRCADTSGQPQANSSGGVQVSCDGAKPVASAAVIAAPAATTAGVSIARSSAHATSAREAGTGMHVHVESVAEGITVVGGDGSDLLRIGEARSVADAWAHGRPGTAHTQYSRQLKRVFIAGREQCSTSCDPDAVRDAINANSNGLIRVTFPEPDTAAAAGTPKGYEAQVRRDLFEHIEDVKLNEQPEDRLEVPAMVITVFADGQKPSRLIVELAGTEAEARYGIFPLASGSIEPLPEVGFAGGGSGLLGGLLGPVPGGRDGGSASPGPQIVTPNLGRLQQVLRILRNPLRLFTSGDPGPLLVVWGMLLLPVYLSARRWLLLRRAALFEESAP